MVALLTSLLPLLVVVAVDGLANKDLMLFHRRTRLLLRLTESSSPKREAPKKEASRMFTQFLTSAPVSERL